VILFDTSVVIDARDKGSPWHQWAKEQISQAGSSEGAAINSVVLAEACVRAERRDALPALLEQIGFTLIALPLSSAVAAAEAYATYLDRLKVEGKKPASKIPLGDFFIGAHAQAEGMRLVTRDPDRVRTYFPKVELIVPVE